MATTAGSRDHENRSMECSKKKRMFTAVLLLTAAISAPRCSTVDRLSHETLSSTVIVVDIAPNDLGQVMVFVLDDERNKAVFVRNFYSSIKSRAAIRDEQNRCRASLMRYKNRRVHVTWYRNRVGDRELVDINP